MRQATKLLLALAAALALAACQAAPRDAADLLWPDLSDPYLNTTRSVTRSGASYDGVNLSFSVAATLKSGQWRRAFATRHAELYGQTEAEAGALAAAQERAAQDGTEFVLALTAPGGGADKLSSRDERFKVFALSGENKLYPLEIRPMEREFWPQEKLKAFFPYANRWRKFYEVRFERVQPGPLRLVVAGPAGLVELFWVHFE